MNSSNGRTAIVTGGAGGIGVGVARRLAADGFAVAVVDLEDGAGKRAAAEIEQSGGRAVAVAVDVTDEQAVQAAADENLS
jgi:3-oxoacyl-[acyl-carrier protein] reductase